MDDVVNNVNNIFALMPIVQPSPRINSARPSPSIRNSPTPLSRSLIPLPPDVSTTTSNISTLSLRMPNVAIPKYMRSPSTDGLRSTTRPSTSPVNICRTPPQNNIAITIPTGIKDSNQFIHRSGSNISQYSIGSPVNIPTPQSSRKNLELPHNPLTNSSISIVRIPVSPPQAHSEIIQPHNSVANVPVPMINVPEMRRPNPPTLTTLGPTLQSINVEVGSQIAASASIPQPPTPDPLIRREDIVPFSDRPLSPRDPTEITLHGVPLDLNTITPICPFETDSDDEDEVTTNDLKPINHNDLMAQAPISISSAFDDDTTADTTDGTFRRRLEGPVVPIMPTMTPTTMHISSSEQVIIPASPTTHVNVPITNITGMMSSINVDHHLSDPIVVSDSIINPAPPITSLDMTKNLSQNQLSATPRLLARGHQSVPSNTQPVLITSKHSSTNQTTPSIGARQPVPNIHNNVSQPHDNRQPTQGTIRQPVQSVTQSGNIRQPVPIVQNNTRRPVTQTPITQTPITQTPVTQTPITQTPVTQTPVTQTPVTQTPVTQTPVTQTPISRQPAQGIRQPVAITQTPSTIQDSSRDPLSHPSVIRSSAQPVQPVQPVQTKITDAQAVPASPIPVIPNYSAMTIEQQANHRADFRTKFGILRNSWPNYYIPNVTDDMPLEQVHAQYDVYVRHIHISEGVDQYKVYLVIMWLLIELSLTKIGLSIGGYTVSQMRSMNKYERLLIELGETNYKNSGGAAGTQSNWPVEVRIIFIALVNAVTFIIIKMLANYIGDGMATTVIDGLAAYLSGTPPQPGQVLFGGPVQPNTPLASGPAPGGQPLPQVGGPFGGIDIASLLGNLGSMFIRGQAPAANATRPTTPAPTTTAPQTPTTPRFRPAYND